MKRQNGFTLLEVLVSATIIAVLTTIGLVSFSSVNKRSRDVKRKSDMEQIRSALEMYRSDNSTFPGEYPHVGTASFTTTSGLEATLVTTGGFMPAIPADPDSDNSYYIRTFATSGQYTSYCICAHLETLAAGTYQSTCTSLVANASLPSTCNYAQKNP